MGVPGLARWLSTTFPEYITAVEMGKKYCKRDYVYIDGNAVLHMTFQLVFGYGDNPTHKLNNPKHSRDEKILLGFFETYNHFMKIADTIIPNKVLYIAMDGIVPIAKQIQQRKRRYSSVKSVKRPDVQFSSNEITIGTDFMDMFDIFMKDKLKCHKKPFDIIYSSIYEKGEGEHKLMYYARNIYKNDIKSSHAIWSPDGDIPMLIFGSNIDNFLWLREAQHARDNNNIYDMNYIGSSLHAHMNRHDNDTFTKRDFIFLGFLLGNDFLPKLDMFTIFYKGIKFLIDAYSGITGYIINEDNTINWNTLLKLLEEIQKKECRLLRNKANSDRFNEDSKPKLLLKYIDDNNFEFREYRIEYYKIKLGIKYGMTHNNTIQCDTDIYKIIHMYMKNLIWIYKYYTSGIPNFTYYYKYNYAPFVYDMVRAIRFLKNDKYNFDTIPYKCTPLCQMFATLPIENFNIIPLSDKDKKCIVNAIGEKYFPKKSDVVTDCEGILLEHEYITSVINPPFIKITTIVGKYDKYEDEKMTIYKAK